MNVIKHAARVGAELGADIVKVTYSGSPESFHEVVQGCFVPVVIAGGEKMGTDEDILEMVTGGGGRRSGGCFHRPECLSAQGSDQDRPGHQQDCP